ncbi:YncE family protein [Paenibacillus alba]|uniref:YncE family protein n=1 Tax=Paenibacillus alba TaxID=1197127 RepID=A0ABU6FZ22_9BACL|nr:YncE family protein [Paenibacillus alba]MEC0226615.1 YncE family protein [Paenibacillus alba]
MTNVLKRSTQLKAPSKLPQVLAIVPVSTNVGDIQTNSATNRVYYVQGDNQVGILSGVTNRVIRNVKVGEGATYLAVNTRTNRIYVTNFRDRTVSVIDGTSNRVIASVSVGLRPYGIAVHQGSNRIYVANLGGTISVIDGSSNRILQTLNVGGSPALVSANERTNHIYVTNVGKNSLHIINGKTLQVSKTIKVGRNPIIVPGINSTSNRIYIANNLSRFASLVLGNAPRKSIPIQLGSLQSEVAVNPLTNRVYFTSAQEEGRGKLFVLDGETNRILETLQIPAFTSILVNPLTNHYFIGDSDGRNLLAYNGQSNKLLTTLRTGESAGNMALNTRTNRVYVGNTATITVVQDYPITNNGTRTRPLLAKHARLG